ncbi:hypothetical protein KPL71_026457 [Citrus sinensis]|uniref:Uncharacterized protein n=1 Tax=Citrus sinensis TaxID=2711 RepID=A0ACB8I100_CITSI|nr:hypothetical protein KPL71_026457 [Citrus sinensis]
MTSQAVFERRPDGQVKLSFQTLDKPNSESPRLSYTAMITAVSTEQESNLPIYGFSSEGYPVYPDKVNGHFLWDVPEAHMCNPDCPCLDDTDDDEDFEIMRRRRRRKKKPSTPKTLCRPYSSGPPDDPESDQPLPIYKKALRQLQRESSFKPIPAQPKIKSCLMFSSSSQSYQESFPPLERHTDPQTKVVSQPYVQSPITTSGTPEELKQYEAVLNWQTQNASAQNQALHHLGKKIDKVASHVSQTGTKVDIITSRLEQIYSNMPNRISELDIDLRTMINNRIWGPKFNKKEAEIRQLKAELARIDADKAQPSLSPKHNISGLLMATKTEDPSTSAPVVDASSDDDNNADQGSQTELVPPVPEKSSKPSSSPWFTFDDIPRHKWQAQHQEFVAWIDVQLTSPNAQSQNVLREFCSRFTGSLRDWFESLGEYRQLQLIQTTIPIALAVIYEQFIGEPAASTKASRKEYHQMKCCSLKRHHLEMHYQRMSMLYYKLNGFNDPSLKHVFAASLPPELQPELQRQLTAFNLDIANVSLRKIFQLTMLCLDKICEQNDFFKDLIEHKEPFASTCKKPYLKIQCKDDKKCTCPTTKKKHFQKHFHKSSFKKPKKPYRYFRKKDPSQFRKKKYNRCFIYKKRGHFAYNCPNKSAKAVCLIQHLHQSSILSDPEDVESLFSEQSEKDDHTARASKTIDSL